MHFKRLYLSDNLPTTKQAIEIVAMNHRYKFT